MTDLDDLRVQLERLGRQPVPLPRQEFSDKLLRELQSGVTTGDLPMPTPLHSRERRRKVPGRIVALGSIAAALLLVIGLVSVATGGSKQQVTFDIDPTAAASGPMAGVKVDDSGLILENVQDGEATATCQKAGRFKIANGEVYKCKQGETMRVVVKDRHIIAVYPVSADPATTQTAEVASASTDTTNAPTTVETVPQSTASTTRSTSTTAASTTTTSGEPTTTVSKPQPVGGGEVPPSTDPHKVAMEFDAQKGDKQISFRWSRYTGSGFVSYVMVRSTEDEVKFPVTGLSEVIWSTEDIDVLAWIEGDLPTTSNVVRYQLFVVDASGATVASSDVVKVELSLGPSNSSTTAPVPTVTTPSTTTTAPSGGDTKG